MTAVAHTAAVLISVFQIHMLTYLDSRVYRTLPSIVGADRKSLDYLQYMRNNYLADACNPTDGCVS